jgi:Domain of unknown function (DUF4326)
VGEPVRIQRKRTKGWKMPEGAIYVGRPTKWGNRYRIGMCDPNVRGRNFVMLGFDDLVRAYRCYAARAIEVDQHWLDELRGKNLACWCRLDQPCHADVLLELANRDRAGSEKT